MPSTYATLGGATGEILGSLLGGGDATKNMKASSMGADAALATFNAKKASAETQKILDEIDRNTTARNVTAAQIAAASGVAPQYTDAFNQYTQTGAWGSPVGAEGPVDVTQRPAGLTPEMERTIKQANLLEVFKDMSGSADTNVNAMMDASLGGQKATQIQDIEANRMKPETAAILQAAMGGKDLADESARGWATVNKPTDTEQRVAAWARLNNKSIDEAWNAVGGSETERKARLLQMGDVKDMLKLAIPELDPMTYLTLSQGPNGKVAAQQYLESLARNSKSAKTMLPLIKSMLVPGVTAEPAVQGLLATLEAQAAAEGASAPPPASAPLVYDPATRTFH